MPRQIELDGVTHEFPDDATDEEIAQALGGDSASAQPAAPVESVHPLRNFAQGIPGFVKGVGNSAASTAIGLTEIPGKTAQFFGSDFGKGYTDVADKAREELAPKSLAENYAHKAENLAEFYIPGMGLTKAMKGSGLIARMLGQGVLAGVTGAAC